MRCAFDGVERLTHGAVAVGVDVGIDAISRQFRQRCAQAEALK
jgi:hypothetical protein